MVMKRICPVCKKTLTSSSVYFCEHCGNTLPPELQLKPFGDNVVRKVINRKVKVKKEPFDLSKIGISTRSVVVGVLLGIALSLVFFQVLNLMSKPKPSIKVNVPSNVNDRTKEKENIDDSNNVVETFSDVKSGDFGQNDIYSYVPYDSSLYFESNDSSTLGSYFSFMGGEFFTLYENIKGSLQPSYGAFYLTKGLKSGWVIISFISDGIGNSKDYDSIYTKYLTGNALVISQEPVLIDEVTLSKNGISKSLSVHPYLISIKDSIPKSGKEFILKVSKDGDASLENLIKSTLSDEFKNMLIKFRGSNSSYMVIK